MILEQLMGSKCYQLPVFKKDLDVIQRFKDT